VRRAPGRRGDVAHRLWLLEREALRARLRHQGVALVSWPEGAPFDPVLREVLAIREAVLRWAW
jgi:hypothetical protein